MKLYFQFCLVLLILVSGNADRALADTVYTYTGNAVSNCNGIYVVPCSQNQIAISGYFTVANELAANLSFSAIAPTSFSFSDGGGIFALSSAQSLTEKTFLISTDSQGHITFWGIALDNIATGCANVDGEACIGTYSNDSGSGDYTGFLSNQGTPSQSFGSGQNGGVPGLWTISQTAVPEPSSLMLLGTGMAGIMEVVRRKRRA
jgi:hypothetical protein